MGDNTAIEWTDSTWNPFVGCTAVSPGCDHCYAARQSSGRLKNTPTYKGLAEGGIFNGTVRLLPDRLDQPIKWTRPRRIFVNSMSDLFHEGVPDDYVAKVFAVMSIAKQHTFQVLTKRHGRMRSLLRSPMFKLEVDSERLRRGVRVLSDQKANGEWPLPNVWMGVSVEDQKWADVRIPALLATPAAVRFLSCEPLLGPLNLIGQGGNLHGAGIYALPDPPDRDDGEPICQQHGIERCWQGCTFVDWVIVGGESGPGGRPMHPDWVRGLRDECVAAGVAFYFKQWGEWAPDERSRATHLLNLNGSLITVAQGTSEQTYGSGSPIKSDLIDRGHPGWVRVRKVGKRLAGRTLDDRTWDEWPNEVASV